MYFREVEGYSLLFAAVPVPLSACFGTAHCSFQDSIPTLRFPRVGNIPLLSWDRSLSWKESSKSVLCWCKSGWLQLYIDLKEREPSEITAMFQKAAVLNGLLVLHCVSITVEAPWSILLTSFYSRIQKRWLCQLLSLKFRTFMGEATF